MTNQQILHYLKGNKLNISQIKIDLTKTQLMQIVQEALSAEDNSSILRALTPTLPAFPQFPEHTNVSIDSINEDLTASLTLKVPVIRAPKPDTADEEDEQPIEPEVESDSFVN